MTPERKQKIIKETKSIAIIIVAVFAFRSTFFEPFRIPTGSMIPTLLIGDFILVNKFSYGFKVPYSDMFTDPIYITPFKSPKRGDVIVFKYPKDTSFNYIKRVIGLPGDTIQMVDKVVYVNDQPFTATAVDGKIIMSDMDDKFTQYSFSFKETQTGDHKHITQIADGDYAISNFPKITVPEKNYFVMGDNRDFSADSRYWGFVPERYIKGKAMLIWFSMIIPLLDDNPPRLRPWRIGKLIP